MTDRYAVISTEKATYPVARMCEWLDVSRAGYYQWVTRPASATARRRATLATLIEGIFGASGGTYGARRITADLRTSGKAAGVKQVGSIMRERGLVACQPRPYKRTTYGDRAAPAPDLVARDFTAARPRHKLVGDITYVRTWAGWLYLATVIDCFSRQVIGWSMAEHLRAELVVDALDMAAKNGTLDKEAIFHSDRGTQYTSATFRAALATHGMRQSMGRTGVCWDNALAESFFGTLKNECVHRHVFPTHRHARTAIAKYIVTFYNRRRIHSSLGYRTPQQVENEHHSLSPAA